MTNIFTLSSVREGGLALALLVGISFFIGEKALASSIDVDREILTACFLSPDLASLAFIPAGVAQGLDLDLARANLYNSCREAIGRDGGVDSQTHAAQICEHLVQAEGMCITGLRDQVLRRLQWQWAGGEIANQNLL